MASSKSENNISLRLTLDTTEATAAAEGAARSIESALSGVGRSAASVGTESARALREAAQAGEQTARSVEKIGSNANMSARAIRMAAVGMAGMALNAYGAWADNHGGRSSAAAYAQGALGGAAQGAAMGMMLGPWGAAGGALLGAGVGAFTTYQQRDAAEKAEAQAREKTIAGLQDQLKAYDELRARTQALSTDLELLGDETMSAAEREGIRKVALASRQDQLYDNRNALNDAIDSGDSETFSRLMRERSLLEQEMAALKRVDISESATHGSETRGRTLDPFRPVDNLAKIGGVSFAGLEGAFADVGRQTLDVERAQLTALQTLVQQNRAAPAAVWN